MPGNNSQVVKMFVIGVSAVLSLGLAGCGGGNSSSDNDAVYHFADSEALNSAIANYAVRCQGECPTNAGVLLARSGNDLSTCSFSVVAKDVILTNRHCIPNSIAYEGASCGDSVQAILLKNGIKDVYKCDKVISFAKDYSAEKQGVTADFAFLKLQRPTSVKPLPISQTGVQDNEELIALTATPDKSAYPYGSIMIQKRCAVLMNSLLDSTFINPFTPLIGLKYCEIVHGNSGSALINAKGELKGVVQSTVDASAQREGDNIILNQFLNAVKSNHFGKGTNAVCLYGDDLSSILPKVSKCDRSGARYETSDAKEQEQLIKDKVNSLNNSPTILKFKELTKETTTEQRARSAVVGTVTIVPDCIRGSKNNLPWLSQFERTGWTSKMGKYPASALAKYDQYTYTYTARVDKELHVWLTPIEEVAPVKIELPLSEMIKAQNDSYDLEATIDGEEAHFQLGFCEK